MEALSCERGCFFLLLAFVIYHLLFIIYFVVCHFFHTFVASIHKYNRMKRMIPLFLAALIGGSFTSCSEKKKSDVIIAPKPQAPKPKKTQKMSE